MNPLETRTFAKVSLLINDSSDLCHLGCQLGNKEERKTKQEEGSQWAEEEKGKSGVIPPEKSATPMSWQEDG